MGRSGYDIELLPIVWNEGSGIFFSAYFMNDNEEKWFEVSPRKDDSMLLLEYLKTNTKLYGYNNHSYDDLVLECFIQLHAENVFSVQELYNYSKNIFNSDYREKALLSTNTIDLMTLTFQYKAQKSLKMVGIMLEHEKLSESKVDFTTGLGLETFDLDYVCDHLIEYNRNDVVITKKLYEMSYEKIQLREDTMKKYPGLNVLSSYDSELAKQLFLSEYQRRSGINPSHLRTLGKQVVLKDLIPDNILFDNVSYQKVIDTIKDYKVDLASEYDFKFTFSTKAVKHDFAAGGIHSVADAEYYHSKQYDILDVDFGSYYPFIMLNFECYPRHLDKDIFLNILRESAEARMELKRLSKIETDKEKIKLYTIQADRLKIVINATYGLFGSDSFFLYDEEQRLKVCVIGELIILYMIYEIESKFKDTTCIYSNTDGFTVKSKSKKQVQEWCDSFAKNLNFVLEYNEYDWCALSDVNNYIIKTKSGKMKRKGLFEWQPSILKSYSFPVIPLAVEKWFNEGIRPEVFINQYNDIHKYCCSQKFDKNTKLVQTCIVGNDLVEYNLPKTIRWFISTKQSKLKAHDIYEGKHRIRDLSAKVNAEPLYDIENIKYSIDKKWYIAQANKIINKFNKPKSMYDR